MTTPIDTSKCPLCGKENNCLNVRCGGGSENGCWCNNPEIEFPPQLTEQVPAECKHQACICESCARAFAIKI